ncbi:52 kDa repressor of the inhibitor of the protein kinase-like [Corticium candelabrum]|uniref:52 kDa repressor of the inhibitor of the protein kinase-like n=1 Tax=Corticium candelabrum TaxID=121492 RepID=UPI002E257AD4|nr:52 kDa repressor of the inhibitor of the protein kinase-like [Corticium candelabrum]
MKKREQSSLLSLSFGFVKRTEDEAETTGRLSLGQLVTTPMTCFTRAKQTLQENNVQATHRVAMEDSAAYIGQMEDGHSSVEQQLQTQAFDVIQRNRAILRSILKAVIFCGRQNIALRGHCESKLATDEESKHVCNSRNFQALLWFGMDAGDQILREHLATAPRNAQYHSPTIQNDLIAATSQWIQKKIVQEVKEAKFFAVCADEAADAANKEQLALIIPFVDKSGLVQEHFLEFLHCASGVSGEAIAQNILCALEKHSLDVNNLRGQGYHGAGKMAGKYQGAAARIQRIHPKAIYVHCAAHILNLCIVAACKVQGIRNMQGTLDQIYLFFSLSPKREQELQVHIKELHVDQGRRTKLVNTCKTRWVARMESFQVFMELLPSVVTTLEVVSTGQGWNAEPSSKAATLLTSITQFEFVMALVVAHACFDFVKGLTVSLQGRSQDICSTYVEVDSVKTALYEKKLTDDGSVARSVCPNESRA